jgi:hypothetical protein
MNSSLAGMSPACILGSISIILLLDKTGSDDVSTPQISTLYPGMPNLLPQKASTIMVAAGGGLYTGQLALMC